MYSQIHVSQAEFVQPPQCSHCGGQMRLVPIVYDSSVTVCASLSARCASMMNP